MVTREEYEELFLAMTRLTDRIYLLSDRMDGHSKIWDKLTDRIEALEKRHPKPGTWHAHRDLPVEEPDDGE